MPSMAEETLLPLALAEQGNYFRHRYGVRVEYH
jgi:hypothetical protein